MSSASIAFIARNWVKAPDCINHFAAAWALFLLLKTSWRRSEAHCAIKSALWYRGHWNNTWCTVCLIQPHSHRGRISGTLMDASHALSPITSVWRRNNTMAFAFIRFLYNGIIGFPYGVFHIVSIQFLAFTCHHRRHFKSTHFAIKMVSRQQCWWPPIQ